MPFGKNRSSFNPTLEKKFVDFVKAIQSKNIVFTNNDFFELRIDKLTSNDLIYSDSPYYNSVASYNENGGWTIESDRKLRELLDKANSKNIKFAMSNDFSYDNIELQEWALKYNIHNISYDYSNCNYHRKETKSSQEVLITNY